MFEYFNHKWHLHVRVYCHGYKCQKMNFEILSKYFSVTSYQSQLPLLVEQFVSKAYQDIDTQKDRWTVDGRCL